MNPGTHEVFENQGCFSETARDSSPPPGFSRNSIAVGKKSARCSASCPGSYYRLQVGTHHIRHSANLGSLPQLVHGGFPASPRFPESLQRDFQTDLVPEFEGVGDGLGWTINLDSDLVYFVFLDTEAESLTAEAEAVVNWLTKLPFSRFCSLMGLDDSQLQFV